jgi:ketosteroid isomerase-like protein
MGATLPYAAILSSRGPKRNGEGPVIRIHDLELPAQPDRAPVAESDVELVRDGYELWNAGDVAGLAELCFSDDIEYRNSPEWPGQRVYRGSETVVRFLTEEVAEIIGLEGVTIDSMDVFGDEILIALRAQTHGFESGIDFGEVPLFHVARMRDGKVSRVRVYLDEDQALNAARTGAG